jgi:leader peptidase (prepilin peptidase)/N-methyltransferase
MGWIVAYGAVVGLCLGSFLNALVYRAPRHLSVLRSRSFCPRCKAPIRGYDNIPLISWVVLGGKCRSCSQPISIRYPLLEVGCGSFGALVAASALRDWSAAVLVVGLALLLVGIVSFMRYGVPRQNRLVRRTGKTTSLGRDSDPTTKGNQQPLSVDATPTASPASRG